MVGRCSLDHDDSRNFGRFFHDDLRMTGQWAGWRKGMPTARGHVKGNGMNVWEESYASKLEAEKRIGDILWWKFEGIKLKLGGGAYFCPDFIVMTSTGQLEVHEVKGFWREAAKVRMKTASEMYPFRFIAVSKSKQVKGAWEVEAF